jgi:hypothetical protein
MTIRRRRLAAAAAAATGLAATVLAVTAAGPIAQAQPAAAKPSGWRIVTLVGGKDVYLDDLAAVSASDIWLGGSQGSTTTVPVLYQLSHGRLKATTEPKNLDAFVSELSVQPGDASNVWAAEDETPYVLHLGKHGWRRYALRVGSDDVSVAGVVPVSARSTWAFVNDVSADRAYFFHFNGSAWRRQPAPSSFGSDSVIGLVSGTAGNNIWALTPVTGALHYNGTRWVTTHLPAALTATDHLAALTVSAQAPGSAWVTMFPSPTTAAGPVVLAHWNHGRWNRITGKLPAAILQGPITSDGHGGLWLYATTPNRRTGLFLHYSGGRWKSYPVPTAGHQPITVNGLTLVPGSDEVLAVGPLAATDDSDAGSVVLEFKP